MLSDTQEVPSEAQDMSLPHSTQAGKVLRVLIHLQALFREGLNHLSQRYGDQKSLSRSEWLRDQGTHGGGWRWGGVDSGILNRGSLNISAIHYDDLPDKRLSSATALSCIVHPQVPYAPSLHTHISWTELRHGDGGGWRLMADLNPSTPYESDHKVFIKAIDDALSPLSMDQIQHAKEQGDRYFYIPALDRHRGVAHYYLEQWKTDDFAEDLKVAQGFGERVVETYLSLLEAALSGGQIRHPQATVKRQIDYHSVYFLQVLTLDRGTSSGLLVHQQNDEGILGSLPQRVSRSTLRSWIGRLPSPQDQLLSSLIGVLRSDEPQGDLCTLDQFTRRQLAKIVRDHYQRHPEALALQARGDVLPPTVANHSSEHSEVDRSEVQKT